MLGDNKDGDGTTLVLEYVLIYRMLGGIWKGWRARYLYRTVPLTHRGPSLRDTDES